MGKTTIKFKFFDVEYKIIAVHKIDFCFWTFPVESVIAYTQRIKAEYPHVYMVEYIWIK